MNEKDILKCLGIEINIAGIPPEDTILYSLIFSSIGEKFNPLLIVKSLSDEKVLEIHNRVLAFSGADTDKDTKVIIKHTRNYMEVMVKNMLSENGLDA